MEDPRERFNLGLDLALSGRWDGAKAAMGEARALGYGDTAAWNALGDLCMARSRYDAAAQAWEASLSVSAGQAETCFKLAFAFECLNRPDEAVAWYQAARTLPPRRLPVLLALAALLERFGRFSEAVPVLEDAVRLQPHDAALALRLAAALEEDGNWAAAESALLRAPADGPLKAEVSSGLAWMRARRGDLVGAAALFEDALRGLAPGTARCLAEGWLAQHSGHHDEAVEQYRKAAEASGAPAQAWEALAGALYRHSDLNGAREAYTRLAELKPRHVEAWLRLGSLNLKLGRKDDARRAWEQAQRIDPGNSLVRRNLTVLRES